MSAVIRFITNKFDVSKERPNPINPIPGESLLLWLAEQVKGRIDIPRPDAEDWGWYADITWRGRGYMLGACAAGEEGGPMGWILQIVKHRSLKERLLGRAKMTEDDEVLRFFRGLIEREPSFSGVEIDGP